MTLEVNAPASGVLAEIAVQTGETVAVGALLGSVGASGAASAAKAAGSPPPASAAVAPKDVNGVAPKDVNGVAPKVPAPAASSMPPAPSAAKLATEQGVDLGAVAGSGKRGQVLKGDVIAALANPPAALAPAPPSAPLPSAARASVPDDAAREERVRLTKLRQTIARRLKEAQNNAAMLTTFNEVDMSEVMALRAKYKEAFEKKHGAKLGFMGFFVKACVQALKEVPAVNAEIDGADLVFKNYYHLGIAVGTDKGLVVPVVRDADRLGIAGIEKAIADFGKRAREGQLKIDELQGGTFTITNGGIYGSLMSTPILNAPQSGILGMHKIQDRPVAVAGKVEIRPMMYLAL